MMTTETQEDLKAAGDFSKLLHACIRLAHAKSKARIEQQIVRDSEALWTRLTGRKPTEAERIAFTSFA